MFLYLSTDIILSQAIKNVNTNEFIFIKKDEKSPHLKKQYFAAQQQINYITLFCYCKDAICRLNQKSPI